MNAQTEIPVEIVDAVENEEVAEEVWWVEVEVL